MRDVQAVNRVGRLRGRYVEVPQALTFSFAPAFFRFGARHKIASIGFRLGARHRLPIVEISRPSIRKARDQLYLGERQV